MTAFRLRPRAQRDLAEIWLQTAERWSVDQAEIYIRDLRSRIAQITRNPKIYPVHQSKHGQFHKAASGSHLIFYLIANDYLDVVRILHNRSDYDEALD